MSSDEKRLTPDELKQMTETRSIETLSLWEQDPYGAADLGAETIAQARFGQTETVLVHGELVLWGGVIVEAERIASLNGGTVSVLDVARKGWSLAEAKAEVLRRHRRDENTDVDGGLFAEMLLELWDADQELVEDAGYSQDEIDAVVADINAEEPPVNDAPSEKAPRRVTCPACAESFIPGDPA